MANLLTMRNALRYSEISREAYDLYLALDAASTIREVQAALEKFEVNVDANPQG